MAATKIGKSGAPIGKLRDAKDVPLPIWGGVAQAIAAPAPVAMSGGPR